MAAGDLTDLTSVKAWLGVTSNTSDTLLSSLITAASTFIKQYLNQEVLSASYTETYQGFGHSDMLLRQGPITAVASVAWRGRSITTAGNPLVPTTGFLFDGRTLSLVGACFPYRERIVVTYTAGYATVPADIKQVANEMVGEAFKRRDRIGINSQTIAGGVTETISYSVADLSKNARNVLAPYKLTAPI